MLTDGPRRSPATRNARTAHVRKSPGKSARAWRRAPLASSGTHSRHQTATMTGAVTMTSFVAIPSAQLAIAAAVHQPVLVSPDARIEQ